MKHFISVLVAAFLISNLQLSYAQSGTTWSLDSWLSCLPDDTYLCSLTIPGTHDSCTYTAYITSDWAMTQNKTLKEQFESGIRCFDLRPGYDEKADGCLTIHHGAVDLDITFNEAVDIISNCVYGTKEFAIIFVLHEGGDAEESKRWIYYKEVDMKSDTERYVDFRPDLTLGEVRGKILVFNRDDLAPYGDNCFGAFIDGSYGAYSAHNSVGTLSVGGKSESKGHAVCKFYSQDEDNYTWQSDCKEKKYKPFVATAEAYFNDPDYFTWCSNHLSAWVGITPLSMDYYENAQALHPMVINYCKEQKKYHEPGKWRGLGICMMDCAGVDHWPIFQDHEVYGKQMVDALINLNF